jgi:Leucine-rich repeat (LRR) protein
MVVLAHLVHIEALPRLTTLSLSGNDIGDGGMTVLTDALAAAPPPRLTALHLRQSGINCEGFTSFSAAIGRGALTNLQDFDLSGNEIRLCWMPRAGRAVFISKGVDAFSSAIARGALEQLLRLNLCDNRIGPSLGAFCDAIKTKGVLRQLQQVNLARNALDDLQVLRLSNALLSGALPWCNLLELRDNKAGTSWYRHVVESLEGRTLDVTVRFSRDGDPVNVMEKEWQISSSGSVESPPYWHIKPGVLDAAWSKGFE